MQKGPEQLHSGDLTRLDTATAVRIQLYSGNAYPRYIAVVTKIDTRSTAAYRTSSRDLQGSLIPRQVILFPWVKLPPVISVIFCANVAVLPVQLSQRMEPPCWKENIVVASKWKAFACVQCAKNACLQNRARLPLAEIAIPRTVSRDSSQFSTAIVFFFLLRGQVTDEHLRDASSFGCLFHG